MRFTNAQSSFTYSVEHFIYGLLGVPPPPEQPELHLKIAELGNICSADPGISRSLWIAEQALSYKADFF